MEQKRTIDLLSGFDAEKVKQELKEKLFKEEKIKSEKRMDPMALGISLLSNPKRIKKVLILIASLSIIGLISTIYLTVSQLIELIEYIYSK